MLDKDSKNPFLRGEHAPEMMTGALCSLITSTSLTVTHDPQMSTAFVSSALGGLVSLTDERDANSALRGLLFEVTRYIHTHVDADVPVVEGERAPEHEEVLARDPRTRLVTTAATEWFRLTCAQKDDAAVNVLKAIHKELSLPLVPPALLYVATVAVCSLAVSVHMQYLADDGEEGDSEHVCQ
jgi:hypothetical protein